MQKLNIKDRSEYIFENNQNEIWSPNKTVDNTHELTP